MDKIRKPRAAKPMVFIPLAQETRVAIPTRDAAIHLNRAPMTLRLWSSNKKGPILPVLVGNRLAWRVADIKNLLNGNAEVSGAGTASS